MKVLLVHNEYKLRSGEETAVENEITALKNRNHEVITYFVSNSSITGIWSKVFTALSSIYSFHHKKKIRQLLNSEKPDIVHVHNFFPKISSSVFDACILAGIPCVHTLHNYRLLCPSTTLFFNGKIYEHGINGNYLNTFRDRTYRNSYLATFVVITSILFNRYRKIWQKVDCLIALSEFQRDIFYDRINAKYEILPHFSTIVSEHQKDQELEPKQHVYVGRLDSEKGILKLLDIWPKNKKLAIIGGGPLAELIALRTSDMRNVDILGKMSREKVLTIMRNAISVVLPSICHETFGLTIIESYSTGTPVLVNNIAPINKMVINNHTGMVFDIDSAESLIIGIKEIEDLNSELRINCMSEYKNKFSEQVGILALEKLLLNVIENNAISKTTQKL